jgi:hypothetical protein
MAVRSVIDFASLTAGVRVPISGPARQPFELRDDLANRSQ